MKFYKPKTDKPLILHMVTWFPRCENSIEGIFTKRQIELLIEDKGFRHLIVQHSENITSSIDLIRGLLGWFKKIEIGKLVVYQIPNNSSYNRRILGKKKEEVKKYYLNRLIRTLGPSIIHLHVVYGFAKEAVYVWDKWKIPFIVSEHMGPFPFNWIDDKELNILKPMRTAKRIVAVSAAQATQITNYTGEIPAVIPNYVDPNEFYFDDRTFTNDRLNIVFVGIYDSRKGVDYLLHTLPSFLVHYPNCLLHLVGEASEMRMNEIMSVVRLYGVEESIVFHGKLNPRELCSLYNKCDFYICSSEWESFGLTVLEALFTGLPVLSTNCGGILDFINEHNGVVIENDRNTESLLRGMLNIVNKLQFFKCAEISERAIADFSGESIRLKYCSIYHEILQDREECKVA